MSKENVKYVSKKFLGEEPDESGAICTSIQRWDNKRYISYDVELRIQDCNKSIHLAMDFCDREKFRERIAKLDTLVNELEKFRSAFLTEGENYLKVKEELEKKLKSEKDNDED